MSDNEDIELGSIKKPGVIEYISNEEYEHRIKQIAKAKRDICWWAENYFRIVSVDEGLITIKLYDRQRELLHHIVNNNKSIVLASRQVGKCVYSDEVVKLRNKTTGEIVEMPIGEFYEKMKAKREVGNH